MFFEERRAPECEEEEDEAQLVLNRTVQVTEAEAGIGCRLAAQPPGGCRVASANCGAMRKGMQARGPAGPFSPPWAALFAEVLQHSVCGDLASREKILGYDF